MNNNTKYDYGPKQGRSYRRDLSGKRKTKSLPFFFLPVFRKSQLELFIEYL